MFQFIYNVFSWNPEDRLIKVRNIGKKIFFDTKVFLYPKTVNNCKTNREFWIIF